ncbi:MAG: ribonuclease H-like domain-containing protein [Pseudomonadota bacterium]
MAKNIIVFDIETKRSFDEVGGRDNFAELGISVLGSFDYAAGEFIVYEEGELALFAERLQKKPLLVGFNSRRFDTPILQKHVQFDLKNLPQLDIMEEMTKVLGHRVSLESVAQATLGLGKSGSGLDAIRYYREGRIAELKKYCLDDVRITRDIFEYGASHGELLYTSKFGSGKARAPVSWKVEHPDEGNEPDKQQSLF